jgi:hypothetical protein
MTHKRQRIREAVVATLNTVPGWSNRVFATRARPTEQKELPVVLVYTTAEQSELATINLDLSRTLTLVLELRAKAVGALDDVLDEMSEKAEAAMSLDPRFGGLVTVGFLRETAIGLDGEGDARQSLATLTYEIRYETDPSGA